MEPPPKAPANLFQVYLRLRPSTAQASAERFLLVEDPEESESPTHITLNPPNDRRRAIEKFAFTRVFEEDATQLDLFQGTRVLPLVEGALAPHGGDGTDGLLATLGVTGSGKTHTMLGSKSQRGLTQMALDVIFRSVDANIVSGSRSQSLEASIQASDASEASISSASAFLETVYGDGVGPSRAGSRAATPMTVWPQEDSSSVIPLSHELCPNLPGLFPASPQSVRASHQGLEPHRIAYTSPLPAPNRRRGTQAKDGCDPGRLSKLTAFPYPPNNFMSLTAAAAKRKDVTKTASFKTEGFAPATPRRLLQRPSALPQAPDLRNVRAECDPASEYAIVISMYEVYNDRIFDLLSPPIKSNATKEYRRRPLLFKSTEQSPDRKVVAGLRKVICGTYQEALMVLEAGLHERRVAGTGSNSVSSRSHGFFCVEIKKRRRARSHSPWSSSTLSIVDLAGSERARDAKTQGATLAEAGKINESLMYLGQCLQMQSDIGNTTKPNLVPFRQCKLTELLFSNSFPSSSNTHSALARRPPQKAVMIVTADPVGDFNATSQILRYSALAREITVPRIPSLTQHILESTAPSHPTSLSPVASPVLSHSRPYFPSGHQRTFSPASDSERATMENAALEIARMADMIEALHAELARESEARVAAEARLLSFEDRVTELEQEVREECYADFEQRLSLEMSRWKASTALELERGEEHWDRKVEVLARGVGVTITPPSDDDDVMRDEVAECDDKENVLVENLEEENERLRREIAVLKRELSVRTPTKRMPLGERGDVKVESVEKLGGKMEGLRVSSTGSPKKMRKLTARKWDSSGTLDDSLV